MGQRKLSIQDLQAFVGGRVSPGTAVFGMEAHYRITEKGDGFLLQLVFLAPDSDTGTLEWQKCRKWYVSTFSTDTEIVETCFKAARAAMDHELKESFRFDGELVYCPHFDVQARVKLSRDGRVDVRDD